VIEIVIHFQGDFLSMDEDYEKHVEAVQFLKRARSLYEEGSYGEMQEPLEKCLNMDSSLCLGWELLGLYCLHAMALKDAKYAFERAENCKGRSDEAEIALKVMRDPSWPNEEEILGAVNGLIALGQVFLSNSRWRPAALCFTTAKPYIEPSWRILSMLGLIYRELGLLEVSLEYYEEASQMEGAPIELMHDKSVVLIKLGRLSEAEKLLGCLLDAVEDNPQLWNNYGAVLEAQGNDDDAMEAYEKAISIDDEYYPALYSKGRILQKKGLMDEARPILERALDIEGRVFDLDDVTHGEERSEDEMVHIKEVTTKRSKKGSGE
jgi:tetratricopeptide (TPR) repeat protein